MYKRTEKKFTLILNDHLGDWSPEKANVCITHQVFEFSTNLNYHLTRKMASAQIVANTQIIVFNQGMLVLALQTIFWQRSTCAQVCVSK